jgi:archaemetzincin
MNGSNHLEENQKKSMLLCPVCLRKLQFNIKFDILERYENLFHVCQKSGGSFKKEAESLAIFIKEIKESYNIK